MLAERMFICSFVHLFVHAFVRTSVMKCTIIIMNKWLDLDVPIFANIITYAC